MFGIKQEIIKDTAILIAGSLLVAAFAGFSLLRFYEEFRKGVERGSRIRIWFAFSGIAFLIVLFIFIATRLAK